MSFEDVKTLIAKALKAARDAIAEANIGSLESEITYELKFTVATKKEGGIDIGDIIPVGITGKVSKNQSYENTITVVFVKSK